MHLRNDCGRFGDAFSRKGVVPGNGISAKRRKKTAGRTPSVKPCGSATSLSEGGDPLRHRCAMPPPPRGGGYLLQTVRCLKAPPSRNDFPRPGQILPAPGRNVTAGDKERNRCRAATKGGIWQNRQVLPERVPPIAAIRLGLCVRMSLSRPAGRDKLKNIKFIPLIMAERSGAIFQSSLRSAS